MQILSGVVLGLLLAFLWRLIRERGHCVYGVADSGVQGVMKRVIARYTTVHPLNMINSGPTHQQVFRGGTVFSWFDNVPGLADLPKNARSFVVWGKERRISAAVELASALRKRGYVTSIHEPLPGFPPGTFLMVKSTAFLDCAVAFRPHWIKMAFLEATAKK